MLKSVNGKIEPQGWIKEYLIRDKNGITGNLGKLCHDADCGIFAENKVKDVVDGVWSSWWPGETEGNWREAYIRLAFTLNDKDMLENSKNYINKVLELQDQDGYIGIFKPEERFGNGRRSGELWTQSRIMRCLIVYYQNSQDERVINAFERLTDLIITKYGPLADNRSLYQIPDEDGSKTHSIMVIEPILYLYDHFRKPEYLMFCEFLFEDYSRYSPDAIFPCYDISSYKAADPDVPFVGHGPHTCEQLRIPLLLFKATDKPMYYSVFNSAFKKLKENLVLSGSCKSDELIGAYQGNISETKKEGVDIGKCYPIPGIGYEYCSTTELMFSFNTGLLLMEDFSFADYEEWMVMNSAMAARRQDGKAILYLCSDNLYKASKSVGDRWDYSPTHIDAAVCCAPNSCKVMPYHMENMWLTDEKGSLYVPFYGPCTLNTAIDGINVAIEEITKYPFENRIELRITSDGDFCTAFHFRIPEWSMDTSIYYNGAKEEGIIQKMGKGTCIKLEGRFRNGDRIVLTFVSKPKLIKAIDQTAAVANGPLLYSLNIPAVAEDYYHYELEPFCDTNYLPEDNAKWDYTLLYDEKYPEESVRMKYHNSSEFEWERPPVTMEAKMLSSWAIPQWVELIPIGCTILRRTTFPHITINKK